MFTILTDSRSGSHLLQALLDSHSQLKCYGELLGVGRDQHDFYSLGENEGCVVSYANLVPGHSTFEGNDVPRILEVIKANKVLHLVRDLMERARSQQFYTKAKKADNGVRANMLTAPPALSARLYNYDEEEIAEFAEAFAKRQRTGLSLFARRTQVGWLQVDYDQLCGGRQIRKLPMDRCKTLCDYLEVPTEQLTTNTYKLRK